jgi:hypothetical protein
VNPLLHQILALYPTPDAQESEEQSDRLFYVDLPKLTEDDLRRELAWLRCWNFVLDSPWHAEREERVSEELRRRHERRHGRGTA